MKRNLLSFDLEEYFQVSGFEPAVGPDAWGGFESRVELQAGRVLDLLDEYDARATFFVLGWTAERHPELVRRIVRRGHEVASHGYYHGLLYEAGPRAFRRDVRRSRRALEGILGCRIHGYRAPSFSITAETLWALPILAANGFVYDSSIFPIRHDRYGLPGARSEPHDIDLGEGRRIREFPPLTRRSPGGRLAAGGGGWFRLFPLAWTRGAIRQANAAGVPAVLYLHPWELDPEQPRIEKVGRAARFRHFVGMKGTERKLRALLGQFAFTTAADLLDLPPQCLDTADPHPSGRTAIRRLVRNAG